MAFFRRDKESTLSSYANFSPGSEESFLMEKGNFESEYLREENENDIAQKVIAYLISGTKIARLNQCERGEITIEEYKKEVMEYIHEEFEIDEAAADRVYDKFYRFVWRYYIIDPLIDDPDISDIRLLGKDQIYYKKKGIRYKSDIRFRDDKDYERFLERVILKNKVNAGSQNAMSRFVDCSLKDWILRFDFMTKYIMSAGTPSGILQPHLHIRKHPKNKLTLEQLEEKGMLTNEARKIIEKKIKTGESFLVSGKGGSGKTTLINAMLELIPDCYSIYCIQEAEEIFSMRDREFVSAHTVEGRGETKIRYSLDELATNALVSDIDVFILGEIKDKEARDFLIAAHTGAICYGSTHSESIPDSFTRIVDYAKRASDYSATEIKRMLKSLRCGIFLDGFKVVNITENIWNEDKKAFDFRNLYVRKNEVKME